MLHAMAGMLLRRLVLTGMPLPHLLIPICA